MGPNGHPRSIRAALRDHSTRATTLWARSTPHPRAPAHLPPGDASAEHVRPPHHPNGPKRSPTEHPRRPSGPLNARYDPLGPLNAAPPSARAPPTGRCLSRACAPTTPSEWAQTVTHGASAPHFRTTQRALRPFGPTRRRSTASSPAQPARSVSRCGAPRSASAWPHRACRRFPRHGPCRHSPRCRSRRRSPSTR